MAGWDNDKVRVKKEMNEHTWGKVKDELANVVGRDHFRNWIEPLQFAGVNDGTATFHVPTNFMGDWVSRHYGDLILTRLKSAQCAASRVQFVMPPRPYVVPAMHCALAQMEPGNPSSAKAMWPCDRSPSHGQQKTVDGSYPISDSRI